MLKLKKYLIYISMIVIILLMGGCSNSSINNDKDTVQIEIANEIFSNPSIVYDFIQTNEKKYSTSNFRNDSTTNYLKLSFSPFSGIYNLFEINADLDNDLKFTLDSKIEGKCMLLLVNQKETIILFDSTTDDSTLNQRKQEINVPILEGKSYLVLIGVNTHGKFKSSDFKSDSSMIPLSTD